MEQHAHARHVAVRLRQKGAFVQLIVKDDGIGLDPEQHPSPAKKKEDLGLLNMRERAAYLDGTLTIRSIRRAGTEIEVNIPLPPAVRGMLASGC